MGPLEFPAGSMLTVHRAVEGVDAHGDPIGGGYQPSHQIGPCSIVKREKGREVEKQERITNQVRVRCQQVDADLRSNDRVQLPNGRIVDVVSVPYVPTNSFTGWRPSLRFTLEEVS